ncbi:MAG: ABC transporter substrate-binding protein [Thermomicrobiales bacterium]
MGDWNRRFASSLSRRNLLVKSTALGAGAVAASKLGSRAAAQTAPTSFQEAPTLADRVTAGEIPAVAERLPANPLVLEPVEQVGTYGGEWRSGLVGGQDTAWLVRTVDYEHLVRWSPDWTEVIPNIAESFEIGADGTEYTFTLREGMKWSDGAPFTADDITFWWDDVSTNADLTPDGPPEYMKVLVEGEKVEGTVEKVDDLTVKFVFPAPNGLFLQLLATPDGAWPTRCPRHYLEQFHQTYNAGGLDPLIQEANATDWINLFQLKGAGIQGTPYDARWQNPELPKLDAWILTAAYGEGTRVVAERNPFYWKVDTDGNQLPYIDRVVYDILEDPEVLVLKALNGEIDMQDRHIASLPNKAIFTDNMEEGQYGFFETVSSSMNSMIFALNLNHKDPVRREVYQNKDFRIGLSHAIYRQEIIDVVYVGQGEPHQAGPRPESPLYHERLAKQYTEYDVALANQHLDAAGYTERDGDGFRLDPNGQKISVIAEVTVGQQDRIDALELIAGYWQEVGIELVIKSEDRALLYTRKEANDHDAVIWGGDGGLDVILEPRWYFPFNQESNYAEAWVSWYTQPPAPLTPPEEPPAPTQQQMELYNQLKTTADPAQQSELMTQILEIAADQFYVIGISLPVGGYGIVKNNFHNVPASMPGSWLYPNPAPANPSQFFITS